MHGFFICAVWSFVIDLTLSIWSSPLSTRYGYLCLRPVLYLKATLPSWIKDCGPRLSRTFSFAFNGYLEGWGAFHFKDTSSKLSSMTICQKRRVRTYSIFSSFKTVLPLLTLVGMGLCKIGFDIKVRVILCFSNVDFLFSITNYVIWEMEERPYLYSKIMLNLCPSMMPRSINSSLKLNTTSKDTAIWESHADNPDEC